MVTPVNLLPRCSRNATQKIQLATQSALVAAMLFYASGCGNNPESSEASAVSPPQMSASSALANRPIDQFPGADNFAKSLNKAWALYEDTQFNQALLLCRDLEKQAGAEAGRDQVAALAKLAKEAKLDASKLKYALSQLNSSNSASVAAGKDILIQAEETGRLFLRKQVRDSSGDTAAVALELLADARDEHTPPMLVELLRRSDDPYAQGMYVQVLERLGAQLTPEIALELLALALEKEPFRFRKSTFAAVAAAASQPGVDIKVQIKAALDKAPPLLAADMLLFLAASNDPDVPSLAIELLGKDIRDATRQTLTQTLTKMSPQLTGAELAGILKLLAADQQFADRELAGILANTLATRCNNNADSFNELLGSATAHNTLIAYIERASTAGSDEVKRWGELYKNMFVNN